MDWKPIAAIGGVAIVMLAAILFGKPLETDWFSINPRTDIVEVNNLAQLIKQDASERAIILIGRRDGQKLPSYSSCAEPPPDALQDVARSISASFDALAKLGDEKEASAALKAADDLKTASKALFERSQGIQLLRDTMFRLCEAFQNGVIDPESYSRLIESLILNANFIIPFEQCMSIARSSQYLIPEMVNSLIESCLMAAFRFNETFVDYSIKSQASRLGLRPIHPNSKEKKTGQGDDQPEPEIRPKAEVEVRAPAQEKPSGVESVEQEKSSDIEPQ